MTGEDPSDNDHLGQALEEALADGSVIVNPLAATQRTMARDIALALAQGFEDDLRDGLSAEQLDDLGMTVDQAEQRLRELVGEWRSYADAICRDHVPFDAASEVRSLLADMPEAAAKEAAAALDEACEAVVPLRARAMVRSREELREARGWDVTAVMGRGEPLPLPGFAYTSGLAESVGHPELVMVGLDPKLMGALLGSLCEQVVAGERRVEPHTDLDGVLADGYRLRVVPCPENLRAELRMTCLDDGAFPDAVQLLVSDEAGRFPGDPGCDEVVAAGQTWPEYADPDL